MKELDKILLDEMVQEDMAELLHLEEDTELIDGFIPPDYEKTLNEESVVISHEPTIDDLF